MPRAATGLGKDALDAPADGGAVGEKHGRVEVALDADAGPQARPGFVEFDAPVKPNHVAARLAHGFKERARADGEMDDGCAGRNRLEHLPRVGLGARAVILRPEAPDPGVEHLNGLNSRGDLGVHEAREIARQVLHQGAPRPGVAVHPGFGARVVFRSAALDEVRRQGEGSRREAEKRQARVELGAGFADGFEMILERFAWNHLAQSAEVGGVQKLGPDVWPFVAAVEKLEPKRLRDKEKIGKDDSSVHTEFVRRGHRDSSGEVRVFAKLEKRHAGAKLAVFLHVAARLAHQPNGSPLDGLAAACLHQKRVLPEWTFGFCGFAH